MRLFTTMEHRFCRTPHGAIWTSSLYPYAFFARDRGEFDQIHVLARARDVPVSFPDWGRVDGDGVTFTALPFYIGPLQFALRARQLIPRARQAIRPADAILLRVPSPIATTIAPILRRTGHPFAALVVTDPYDFFSLGAVSHPLRMFFRWWFSRQLRRQCAAASAACYVTSRYLQSRYPCSERAFGAGISDVEITDEALAATSRRARKGTGTVEILTVASLEHPYKGVDVLLEALAVCARRGVDLSLRVAGEGRFRPALESRANALGLGGRVQFLGQIPAGPALRALFDAADLFILPSRAEGLPRAMIEAMARALPCIGSTAGGIPELLPTEDLVTPGDVAELAAKVQAVVANPQRMAAMSARNLSKAGDFHADILRPRWSAFLRRLRDRTGEWLARQADERRARTEAA